MKCPVLLFLFYFWSIYIKESSLMRFYQAKQHPSRQSNLIIKVKGQMIGKDKKYKK